MSVLPCEELQISPSDRVAVEELCDEAKINMYGKPKADSTPLDTTPIPEVVKQVLSKFQEIFPEKLPLGLPAEEQRTMLSVSFQKHVNQDTAFTEFRQQKMQN